MMKFFRITHNQLMPRRQRGVSLMEILVTVIVLAIGLLGIAGLQLTSLKSNSSAYLRSQATILAKDIIDRMQTNRLLAKTGSYDIALGTAAAAPNGTCNGAVTDNCTPDNLVTLDLNTWKTTLSTTLPRGDGGIERVVDGSQIRITVTIQWDDSRGERDPVQLAIETLL